MRKRAALLLCFLATVSCAGPDTSQRPQPRPEIEANGAIDRSAIENRQGGFLSSLRPLFRPPAAGRELRQQQRMLAAGAVCGDIAIQGQAIGAVPGELSGCGIENAVQIASVSGVALSRRATMDCGTARALNRWVDKSAKPSLSRKGGGLTQLVVAADYSCRRRNNGNEGRISEHGKGRAIDISAFQLRNGDTITVLEDWHRFKHRRALRKMHKGACGPFGTVLGPDADRHHQDHFHFDTARYRAGRYCR